MKRLALIAILGLSGCVQASMYCPDGKSSITYSGTNVLSLSPVTASCIPGLTGGYIASVSGVDLMSLAMQVAPIVAAMPVAPVPTPPPPTPAPKPATP